MMVHVFMFFCHFASNFFGNRSALKHGQGLPKVPKNSSEKLRISDDWSSLENAKVAHFTCQCWRFRSLEDPSWVERCSACQHRQMVDQNGQDDQDVRDSLRISLNPTCLQCALRVFLKKMPMPMPFRTPAPEGWVLSRIEI